MAVKKFHKLLKEKLMSPPVAKVSAGATAETARQYRAALLRAALSLGFLLVPRLGPPFSEADRGSGR